MSSNCNIRVQCIAKTTCSKHLTVIQKYYLIHVSVKNTWQFWNEMFHLAKIYYNKCCYDLLSNVF